MTNKITVNTILEIEIKVGKKNDFLLLKNFEDLS